eukprot:TRINITY_DN34_c0_g2_i6.p1 TRINITY_DN34_c0_g2~~TRINITY_DN34_c0_g2_i6.p1  ORF type:complete len:103 (+),score=25.07 TRINITY_DN34_c0_g2_i6:66-374(+)
MCIRDRYMGYMSVCVKTEINSIFNTYPFRQTHTYFDDDDDLQILCCNDFPSLMKVSEHHLYIWYLLILSLIHISEPTRLGMISYAVFCLKKKKTLSVSYTHI